MHAYHGDTSIRVYLSRWCLLNQNESKMSGICLDGARCCIEAFVKVRVPGTTRLQNSENSALSAYIHRTWPNPYCDLSPISKRTNAHKDKSYSREYVVVLTVDVFRQ
jgi:hypothetical protein